MPTYTLHDGSQVDLRPIDSEDKEALAAAFERLSPESRYRRFFAPVQSLSDSDLNYLTRVDHHRHEAIVAEDPGGDGIVGVARFVKTGDDEAEPAIVVADDWQGRGLAGHLLASLTERARDEGVQRFVAPVLATNRGALAVLERLGDTTVKNFGHELELTIELPADPWRELEIPVREPRTPLLEALREAAAGNFLPGSTLWDLAMLRRPDPPEETQNVIVAGTDGSVEAAVAIREAAELARALGATLQLVGVYRPLLDDRDELSALVKETAERLAPLGLEVSTQLRRGDPADALVDIAVSLSARLIVIGARGRGGAARWLLGSVSDKVARSAPCAVLIVRVSPSERTPGREPGPVGQPSTQA